MSGLTEVDILTIVVFCGALLATGSILAVFGGGGAAKAKQDRRIAKMAPRSWERAAADFAASIRKRNNDGRPLDRWLHDRLPRRDALAARLARTGLDITLSRYVLISVAIGVLAGAVTVYSGLPPIVTGAAALAAGLLLPHLWVGFMVRRRIKMFLIQFPEAIDQIVRGVRSGLPVGESMGAIARDMPAPVSTEFQTIIDGIKIGRSFDEALWETSKRLDLPEFNFLVISMIVQRETGGNLAETLANLSDILRRRQQMRAKAKAMASEARASALIVGSLPFVMAGLLYVINPEYLGKLFSDPRGNLLLGAGLFSEMTGFLVMMKMAKFEI